MDVGFRLAQVLPASEDAHNRANRATTGMRRGALLEKGVVRSVEGDRATVEVVPLSPESCESCGGCSDGPTGQTLEIRTTLDLRPGQRVDLEVKGVGELGPAAAVFLLPVAALMFGAITGNLVVASCAGLGISPTLGGVLGALAFVVPAVMVVRWYDRAHARREPQVRILRTRD